MGKIVDIERRLRGRPPMGDKPMQQITVRLTDDLLEAIDVIIDDREGHAERGGVIRELISRGLKSFAMEERLNQLERKRK